MNTFFVDPVLSGALAVLVKASLLVGIAAIVQSIMRARTSAATRHLVWTLTIGGMLMLPLLSSALPDWTLVIRTTAPRAATAMSVVADRVSEAAELTIPVVTSAPAAPAPPTASAKSAAGLSWTAVAAIVYGAGAFVLLIHFALQQIGVTRLARGARDVRDAEWMRVMSECARKIGIDRPVRLLRSPQRSMPMACGMRRPAILIPAAADLWSEERRRAVLLHELAHVARYDCVTQMLAFIACALYWFHPAAWWVARRLRIERELACDDRVIDAGTQPREYAGHLLEIAYAFGGQRAPAIAVSMARPRQLEGRMLAVLDTARNRRVPAVRARLAGLTAAAVVLLPLAALTPTVTAADPEAAPASDASVSPAAPQSTTGPHLKEMPPVAEVARRLVRAAAAAIGVAQEMGSGTWEIRPSKTPGFVQLRLVELNSQSGTNVPVSQLDGLTAAQLTGPGGPVQFRIRRDAGTLTFEGVMRNGVGAGTFSYTPDPNFPAELAKRGFARPTAEQQYQMTRHDIGFAFLDELNKQGYAKTTTAEIVRAGHHGVRADYVREMAALGYRLGSLEALIQLRDHGVTPSYVRELAELGYKGLSADAVRRARDHGVTPDFVRAMRDAGYGSLTMEEIVTARDHGVNAEYIRELVDAGHRNLPLAEVIRVRDHGVSGEYAREMKQLGYAPPIAELVRARDHGVNVSYVRELAALGYERLPLDALIRLRDHGVSSNYVRELKELGYERVPVDDLIKLRDHGLSAERIRAANARAGTRLPIDMLKSLAAGGMR
jgi:beta-lactamase regulating signal transducer with metallopeptidase domain